MHHTSLRWLAAVCSHASSLPRCAFLSQRLRLLGLLNPPEQLHDFTQFPIPRSQQAFELWSVFRGVAG